MKKYLVLLFALMASLGTLCAQKIGYVNTDTILGEIPAYAVSE